VQVDQRPGRLGHPRQHQPVLRRYLPRFRPRNHERPRPQDPVQHRLCGPAGHLPQHRPRHQRQRLTRPVPRRRRPPHPVIPGIPGRERVPGQLRRSTRPIRALPGRQQTRPQSARQLRTELPRHLHHSRTTPDRDGMPNRPPPAPAHPDGATRFHNPALRHADQPLPAENENPSTDHPNAPSTGRKPGLTPPTLRTAWHAIHIRSAGPFPQPTAHPVHPNG
jgi:hypothetical protein